MREESAALPKRPRAHRVSHRAPRAPYPPLYREPRKIPVYLVRLAASLYRQLGFGYSTRVE